MSDGQYWNGYSWKPLSDNKITRGSKAPIEPDASTQAAIVVPAALPNESTVTTITLEVPGALAEAPAITSLNSANRKVGVLSVATHAEYGDALTAAMAVAEKSAGP